MNANDEFDRNLLSSLGDGGGDLHGQESVECRICSSNDDDDLSSVDDSEGELHGQETIKSQLNA